MTAQAMGKIAIAIRNAMPGLLKMNTEKGLSPFMYIAMGKTAIDSSNRKSARRSRFGFDVKGRVTSG
jgi:hypothetical protein